MVRWDGFKGLMEAAFAANLDLSDSLSCVSAGVYNRGEEREYRTSAIRR